MAIKVKLQDGTIQVGGNFDSALAFVKRQDSRSYDGATKTWTIPTTTKKFMTHCDLPTEILAGDGSARYSDGNHVTRYGNVYSQNEWSAQKSVWAIETGIARDYAPQYEASKKQFQASLADLSVCDAGIRMLESHVWDFEDAEGYRLRFSSTARRDQVFAIIEARRTRDLAIGEAEDNDLDAEKERIWSAAGIL